MLDVGFQELALIAVVALIVIGPKDLPRVLRQVGQWVGKARGMARHVRSGFDTMVREAELEEMQKQWAAQNAAIMAAHPMPESASLPGYASADDAYRPDVQAPEAPDAPPANAARPDEPSSHP